MGAGGFGPHNLPYGVTDEGHTVVAWGDEVVDLTLLPGLDVGADVFGAGSLNPFMRLGPDAWSLARTQLGELLPHAPACALRPRSET